MSARSKDIINSSLYAQLTLSQGWSAREGLRRFREAGGHIGNQRWFEVVRSVREAETHRIGELSGDVNAVPGAREITRWENLTKRGYFQQVNVLVRDTSTGELRIVPYTVYGNALISRKEAIQKAIGHIQSGIASGSYEESLVAAVYSGTYAGPKEL